MKGFSTLLAILIIAGLAILGAGSYAVVTSSEKNVPSSVETEVHATTTPDVTPPLTSEQATSKSSVPVSAPSPAAVKVDARVSTPSGTPTIELNATSKTLTLQQPETTISWNIIGAKEGSCSEAFSLPGSAVADWELTTLSGTASVASPGSYSIRCFTGTTSTYEAVYVSKSVTIMYDLPASAAYKIYVEEKLTDSGEGDYKTFETKCHKTESSYPNQDVRCNWAGSDLLGTVQLR